MRNRAGKILDLHCDAKPDGSSCTACAVRMTRQNWTHVARHDSGKLILSDPYTFYFFSLLLNYKLSLLPVI